MPRPVRPLTCEVGGAMTSVPAPALTVEMAPFVTPLPPFMADLMVSWAVPIVQMLSGAEVLTWFITPPEMTEVLPLRTRIPPECSARRTPSARVMSAPPSIVMEFGEKFAPAKVVVAFALNSRLLLSRPVAMFALEYSVVPRGRMMRSPESEVPLPLEVLIVAKE